MKKYTKEELFRMDATDVYKMVLRGDIIKRFPAGFWQQPEAKQNAAKCTRYLIEEILKYDDEMLKEKSSLDMFTVCFNGSPYNAINNAYPNKYKEWKFKVVPMGFWENKENGIRATKRFIEEKLKLNNEEIKEKLNHKIFVDNGLLGMLQQCFSSSPYEAINNVYPNMFKEWELKQVSIGFWKNKENGIKATNWIKETCDALWG